MNCWWSQFLEFPNCHECMVPQSFDAMGKLFGGKIDTAIQPLADYGSGTCDGKFKYKIQVLLIQIRKLLSPFLCGASSNEGCHTAQELWVSITAHQDAADIPVFTDTFEELVHEGDFPLCIPIGIEILHIVRDKLVFNILQQTGRGVIVEVECTPVESRCITNLLNSDLVNGFQLQQFQYGASQNSLCVLYSGVLVFHKITTF